MTREEYLQNVIKENVARINRIFDVVNFGKLNMTNELINDMNDFFVISKNPLDGYSEQTEIKK